MIRRPHRGKHQAATETATAATPPTNTCARISRLLAVGIMAAGSVFVTAPVAMAMVRPAASTTVVTVVDQSSTTALRPGNARLAQPSAVKTPSVASPTVGKSTVKQPGVSVNINGVDGKPSSSLVVILGITALSVAPALLLMTTSFTKIMVVLSITRNALGLQTAPPNQVLAGLALFLSIFIMGPTLTKVNDTAVQPYLNGKITQSKAIEVGKAPMKSFMLKHTRDADIALMYRSAKKDNPKNRTSTDMMTLIPAFVLSELRAAFIIGFVIFIPFLVIDIVVSAVLMSMGMMMLPPVTISLPFKLLLFVMVDGWAQVITALVGSYR